MKNLTRWSTLSALLFTGLAVAENQPDPNIAEARAIIKEFATTLQGELKAAIQQGGPTEAIVVCNERAPGIAADLSERTGWAIGRTSLKTRNTELNTPDDWERQVLERFEERQAAGEPVETMAQAEVIETEDGKTFRFMKAIPTAEVCLACHGTNLTPEVVSALDERYPEDAARGYHVGEIRGAFSLAKPL